MRTLRSPTSFGYRFSLLIAQICRNNDLDVRDLVLHSDNGAPMRSNTKIATPQARRGEPRQAANPSLWGHSVLVIV